MLEENKVLWEGKRRWFFGTTKMSFTKYSLTMEKIIIDSGMLYKKRDEVKLYRVSDIAVRQGLLERMFRIGTIKIVSSDPSEPKLYLQKIKKPYEIADIISGAVDTVRVEKGVRTNEFLD